MLAQSTVRALRQLNRRFYACHGAEFSRTREQPWPGWHRLIEQHLDPGSPPDSVLDAGCGNGRFGSFLAVSGLFPRRYCGVDAEPALLERARRRLENQAGAEWQQADLLEEKGFAEFERSSFDLAVAFGVLHHIPGFPARARFLHELAQRLRPGGLLAVTFWQWKGDDRLERRVLPWEPTVRELGLDIDPDDREPGDALLPFGDGPDSRRFPRFCHQVDDEEREQLLQPLALEEVDRYLADGADGARNLYVVLRVGLS